MDQGTVCGVVFLVWVAMMLVMLALLIKPRRVMREKSLVMTLSFAMTLALAIGLVVWIIIFHLMLPWFR